VTTYQGGIGIEAMENLDIGNGAMALGIGNEAMVTGKALSGWGAGRPPSCKAAFRGVSGTAEGDYREWSAEKAD
jgi:hypothetical protein